MRTVKSSDTVQLVQPVNKVWADPAEIPVGTLVALTGYGPTILTRTTSEAEPFHPEHAEPGTVRHHIRVEGIQTPLIVEQNIKPVKFISQQITPLNSARTLIKEAIDTAAERQSGYSTAESRAYCNGLRAALAVMEATVASTE